MNEEMKEVVITILGKEKGVINKTISVPAWLNLKDIGKIEISENQIVSALID